MDSMMEIMNKGINCLIQQMGIVETEKFISIINRGQFKNTIFILNGRQSIIKRMQKINR